MISVVCARKSVMRLLVFHVDEKTVSVETCEERCGNDVLGGGRGGGGGTDASVACNLSPNSGRCTLHGPGMYLTRERCSIP